MEWHKLVLRELAAGRDVQVKVRGRSMEPRIPEGQIITISPLPSLEQVAVNAVVLVRMRRDHFLIHLVKEIEGNRVLIANNLGGNDGWVSRQAVLGKVIRIGADPSFDGVTVEE